MTWDPHRKRTGESYKQIQAEPECRLLRSVMLVMTADYLPKEEACCYANDCLPLKLHIVLFDHKLQF